MRSHSPSLPVAVLTSLPVSPLTPDIAVALVVHAAVDAVVHGGPDSAPTSSTPKTTNTKSEAKRTRCTAEELSGKTSIGDRAARLDPRRRNRLALLQVDAHREDDHRHADMLQALLDQERRLVVEDAVPKRV